MRFLEHDNMFLLMPNEMALKTDKNTSHALNISLNHLHLFPHMFCWCIRFTHCLHFFYWWFSFNTKVITSSLFLFSKHLGWTTGGIWHGYILFLNNLVVWLIMGWFALNEMFFIYTICDSMLFPKNFLKWNKTLIEQRSNFNGLLLEMVSSESPESA